MLHVHILRLLLFSILSVRYFQPQLINVLIAVHVALHVAVRATGSKGGIVVSHIKTLCSKVQKCPAMYCRAGGADSHLKAEHPSLPPYDKGVPPSPLCSIPPPSTWKVSLAACMRW